MLKDNINKQTPCEAPIGWSKYTTATHARTHTHTHAHTQKLTEKNCLSNQRGPQIQNKQDLLCFWTGHAGNAGHAGHAGHAVLLKHILHSPLRTH